MVVSQRSRSVGVPMVESAGPETIIRVDVGLQEVVEAELIREVVEAVCQLGDDRDASRQPLHTENDRRDETHDPSRCRSTPMSVGQATTPC